MRTARPAGTLPLHNPLFAGRKPMLAQGHLVANRYRLVRTLAQGGMGSLWVAHDTQLGRQVAVKVMVPAASALPELVARFEREAKAAAQLRSAHAVQVYEHGVDRGQPFIVMELLDGEDLAAVLRRERRLSLEQTARLLDSVCKAVRAAHELGIVHRDLKPANIFLAHQDDEIVVKVLDFGVAKLTGPEADVTRAHALLGTPHFMAPEQARDMGIPVDHRADLWALGVIAFRALTGKLPFVGEDPIHVLVSVASQAAPLPSSVAPDLGPEIDDFFAIALARDPAARFQSARAMRDALLRLASTGASGAALPSGWGALPRAGAQASSPRTKEAEPAHVGTGTLSIVAPVPQAALAPRDSWPVVHSTAGPVPPAQFRETVKLVGVGSPPGPSATSSSSEGRGGTISLTPAGTAPGARAESSLTPTATASTNAAGAAQITQQHPRSRTPWVVWIAASGAVLTVVVVLAAALWPTSGPSNGTPVSSKETVSPPSGSAAGVVPEPPGTASAAAQPTPPATANASASATAPVTAPSSGFPAAPSSARSPGISPPLTVSVPEAKPPPAAATTPAKTPPRPKTPALEDLPD
ncbi:MAG: protein kinase [Polyangiaceae bacterium]